jgi:3-oxoacyl-[acyl-carrier-protein] synthase-3
MNAYIKSIGSYVPEKIVTNADMEKIVETSDEWIRTRSGIIERRKVPENEATSDLAIRAVKLALQRANVDPSDVEAIICGTATPDMMFPSTACIIQARMGMGKVMSFDIAAGCSGFLYAVSMAEKFINSGYNNVLAIGAETLTRITNYTDRSTCVLFGDGAGAVLLQQSEKASGILSSYFGADGSYGKLLYQPAGGSLMQASHETVDKHLHAIHMDGNAVFKVAVRAMTESAFKTLKMANVSGKDVALLVPHQANIRIIEATAKRVNIPMERVAVNIDKYGNTSAASIPIALDEAITAGRVKRGDLILMVAFGAGFTWGGMLVKW